MDYFPPGPMNVDAALRDARHRDARVRIQAADALARASDERRGDALPVLRDLADDSSPAVRHAALLSLGELKDAGSVTLLLEHMRDDLDPLARQAAAIAVGLIGDPTAADALIEALAEGPADLRFQATTSLVQVAPERAAPALRAALDDPDPEVRGSAAAALGDLGDAGSADALAAVLDDGTASVQIEAAVSLARLGDRRGTLVLARSLAHRSLGTLAAEHLFRCPDEAALPELEVALERWLGPPLLKVWAAGALARLGRTAARSKLVGFLRSRKPTVKGLAIQIVGELGGAWAVQALQEVAGSRAGRGWAEELAEAKAQAERGSEEATPAAPSGT